MSGLLQPGAAGITLDHNNLPFGRTVGATVSRRRRSAYIAYGLDEGSSMRQHFMASAMALALATGLATAAMASGHGDRVGIHRSGLHSGLRGSHAGIRGGRVGQGSSGQRFVGGYRGAHYEGVAPFGHPVGFGPGYGRCSPNDYSFCGSTFTVGW